jgi:hypothetical protein
MSDGTGHAVNQAFFFPYFLVVRKHGEEPFKTLQRTMHANDTKLTLDFGHVDTYVRKRVRRIITCRGFIDGVLYGVGESVSKARARHQAVIQILRNLRVYPWISENDNIRIRYVYRPTDGVNRDHIGTVLDDFLKSFDTDEIYFGSDWNSEDIATLYEVGFTKDVKIRSYMRDDGTPYTIATKKYNYLLLYFALLQDNNNSKFNLLPPRK